MPPKGGDFKKRKQKVGKKKLAPVNATVTQFKAKSVVLAAQSVSVVDKAEPTTSRNLTLAELQTQLKHYSDDTRHDAARGIVELLSSHPQLILQNATTLLNGLPMPVPHSRSITSCGSACCCGACCCSACCCSACCGGGGGGGGAS